MKQIKFIFLFKPAGFLSAGFLFFLSITASAQQDTTYYLKYPDLLGIGIYEAFRNNNVKIEKLNPEKTGTASSIDWNTNGKTVTGLILNYDKLFFAFGVKTSQSDTSKGNSKNTNISFQLKGNKLVLEASWRNYSGFYDANTFGFRENLTDTVNFHKDESMSSRNLKVKGFYFLNHKKFSYNSAYYGSYRQLKSAISWVVNGNFYFSKIRSGSGLIPYYAKEVFKDYQSLNGIDVTGVSVGIGGAGNLVVFKRFFVNLLVTLAAEPQWRTCMFEQRNETHPFYFSLASDLRGSLGFNSKRFFLILNIINDQTFNSNSAINLSSNFFVVTLSAGYRFHFENKSTKWLKENKYYKML